LKLLDFVKIISILADFEIKKRKKGNLFKQYSYAAGCFLYNTKNTIVPIAQTKPTIEVHVQRSPKDPAGQIINATSANTANKYVSILTRFNGRGLKKVIIKPIIVRKPSNPNIPPIMKINRRAPNWKAPIISINRKMLAANQKTLVNIPKTFLNKSIPFNDIVLVFLLEVVYKPYLLYVQRIT
jgi:hypothetical protein